MAWKNASLEKPDVDELVLVAITSQTSEPVWIGYWDDDNESWYTEDGMSCTVSHWMPLPEYPYPERES